MKKNILISAVFLISLFDYAQTATNFNCKDCAGNTHDLFNELDSGKVIVIDWVMPCGSCVPASLTTYNVVSSYQLTYPGKVNFYLADDYANTNCSSLKSWANGNSMHDADFMRIFSDTSINMYDYGSSTGMPKIVVIGCSSHQVFYNAVNTVDAVALQNAIDAALQCASGIDEAEANTFSAFIQAESLSNRLQLIVHLPEASKIEVELYDNRGEKIETLFSGMLQQGEYTIPVCKAGLAKGIYIARIITANQSKAIEFVIAG